MKKIMPILLVSALLLSGCSTVFGADESKQEDVKENTGYDIGMIFFIIFPPFSTTI
jgi:uncharacterized protein YceK